MPVYVYECQKCGARFEELLGIHDPPLKHCKECRGKVRKIFMPVGIVFKGGGFYATDSRKKSTVESEKSESKPAAGTEKKSEPKPAAKTA